MGDCGATMGLTLYQSITPTSQQGVEEEQEVREIMFVEILFVEKNEDVFCVPNGCASKSFINCAIFLKLRELS